MTKHILVLALMVIAVPALADKVVVHETAGDRTITIPTSPPLPTQAPDFRCTARIQKMCYAECGGDPNSPMCRGSRP